MSPIAALYAAATAGALGDGIVLTALPLATAMVTRDPAATAAVGAAALMPAVAIQPLAGVWADRWLARHLMQIAAGARAVALAMAAAAVLAGYGGPLLLAVTALAAAAGRVVHAITLQTVVPALIRDGERDRVNARVGAADIGGYLLAGPLIGAVIVGLAPAAAIATAAGCFLATAGLAAGLPSTSDAAQRRAGSRRWAAAAGLRWLARHRQLRTVTLLTSASTVAYSITWPIIPLYATGPLGLSPAGTGLLLAAFAIGAITGTPLAHHARALAGDHHLLPAVGAVQATAWTAMASIASTR